MAERHVSARMATFRRRIVAHETVILDGGTGTALQAYGVPMDGEAWSGVANLSHPDTVRDVHADYLDAGAQVLVTNTFAAGPGPLTAAGFGDRFEDANRAAVRAAQEARAQRGRHEAVIAGSMSRHAASGFGRSWKPSAEVGIGELQNAYRRQAHVLADAGVDVIVLEMMGDARHARPAVIAAGATGLPVWLGLSVAAASGGVATTVDDRDLAGLLGQLDGFGIDAVLIMHTDINVVAPALGLPRHLPDAVRPCQHHLDRPRRPTRRWLLRHRSRAHLIPRRSHLGRRSVTRS